MIALDYTVIVQIVAFLVLWFLLAKLLFKPILGLLEERERRTEGVKAEAATLASEAERVRRDYEAGIERARDEGRSVKEALLREALQLRERLLAQAREKAAGILQQAREELRREMRGEQEVAVREAQGIAQQMAGKILGRRVG